MKNKGFKICLLLFLIFFGLFAVEKYNGYQRDKVISELTTPLVAMSNVTDALDKDENIKDYDIQTTIYCITDVDGVEDCKSNLFDFLIINNNTFGYRVTIDLENDADFEDAVKQIKDEFIKSNFEFYFKIKSETLPRESGVNKIVITIDNGKDKTTLFSTREDYREMQSQYKESTNYEDLFKIVEQ